MQKYQYFPFKYLWILVVLPKMVQFTALFAFLVFVIFKDHGRIFSNTVSNCFYILATTQLLAIIFHLGGQDPSRIFAAINTVTIWIIAMLLFGHYKHSSIDLTKIGKYCFINIMILGFLGILMIVVLKFGRTNIAFLGNDLTVIDWQDGVQTLRLGAFMEYPNLIIIFILEQLPLAFSYLKCKSNKILIILLIIMVSIPTWLSHSRAGVVAVAISTGIIIFSTMNLRGRYLQIIIVLGLLAGAIATAVMHDEVVKVLQQILVSRQGSTSMRENIYKTSLQVTLENSPIIGNGIKTEFFGYPLGSHSTYIGLFYKAGLIGLIAAVLGFWFLFQLLYRKLTAGGTRLFYVGCYLALMAFLIFEDLDGAEWSLIIFWSLMGTLTKNVNTPHPK
ncbi:O-antigen ligase family protein [Lactiplantibacillus plantarum]|uniref:O-antigen ligase family protein n=1 Tax=Lactiplantibacillus plantarum TaxID=1590 RepID=UPI003750E318